jgi:hypothetical protein
MFLLSNAFVFFPPNTQAEGGGREDGSFERLNLIETVSLT